MESQFLGRDRTCGGAVDVFALDVGGQTTTAWVGRRADSSTLLAGTDLAGLVDGIAEGFNAGVALGIEAPLFLPAPALDYTGTLTRAIDTQGRSYPWNIHGGAFVTANALPAVRAILAGLVDRLGSLDVTTDEAEARPDTLFVWEAFVSGGAKRGPGDHLGDAALAAWAFQNANRDDVILERPRDAATVALSNGRTVPLLNMVAVIARSLSGVTVTGDDKYLVLRPTSTGPDAAYRGLPD